MFSAQHFVEVLTVLLGVSSLILWWRLVQQLRAGEWPLEYRPRAPVSWSPPLAVWALALAFLIAPVAGTALAGISGDAADQVAANDLSVMLARILTQTIQLVLVPLVLIAFSRCRWADFGLHREGWREDLRAGIWGFLISLLPVYTVAYLLIPVRKDSPHQVVEFLAAHPGPTGILLAGATAVVLAPLVEELLFRVILQGTLEKRLRFPWPILVVALAFVAVHAVVDVLPLIPLALVLGYVYARRRSYLAVVVLHALFNGLSLLLAILTPVELPQGALSGLVHWLFKS